MKSLFFLLAFLCAFSSVGQSSKYFRKAYQTVYGDYVGVYPIEEKDILETNHLTFNYGINGKLESIESMDAHTRESVFSDYINAQKIGFEYTDSSFIIRNYYSSWDGSLVSSSQTVEYVQNPNGKTIRSIELNYDDELLTEYRGTVNYNYKGDQLVSLKLEGDFPYNNLYQSASQIDLKLYKNGLIAEEIVHHTIEPQYDGLLIEDDRFVYEFDENGNFISKKSYDSKGIIINAFDNCAYTKYAYDKNGYVASSTMFDAMNKKTNYTSREYLEDGTFEEFIFPGETRFVTDNSGIVISEKYFFSDGKPAENINGVHEFKIEFDANTNTSTTSYFNAKNELVEGGEGYAGKSVQKDEKGREIKMFYFDAEKKVVPFDDGSMIIQSRYDDGIVTHSFFDAENNPMTDHSGAHRYQIEKDEYDIEFVRVFGLDNEYLGYDQKSDWEEGLIVRTRYAEDDLTILSISYFTEYGKFKATSSEGYFCKSFSYNENGILEKITYLDEELKLVNANFGSVAYAEIRFKFNENQYEIESAYFDAEGNRAIDEAMISIYRTTYNDKDYIIQIDKYAADGNLLHKSMNYATVKYVYDNEGLVIEEAYFNENGQRWSDELGIASYLFEYQNGQLIKSQWRNADYKPAMNFDGIYQVVNNYGENGRLLETRYLNKKGKKMNSVQGAHRIVYSYGSEYDVSVIEIFNKKGKHAEADPLGVGFNYIKVIYQYDEQGYSNVVYYNLNGEEFNYSDSY